MIYQLSFFSFF